MKAEIIANIKLTDTISQLILEAPQNYPQSQPGQFIHINCAGGLLRPFSITQQYNSSTIIITVDAVGPATQWLTSQKPGTQIDITEPCGNGYFKTEPHKRYLLVGGGIGIAPLVSVLNNDSHYDAILCYTNISRVILNAYFATAVDQLIIATDDGSFGLKGRADEIFVAHLKQHLDYDAIFACGPKPMLKAVTKIIEPLDIPCFISLEERMACGIGAAKCCATMFESGTKTICVDGPVFNSREVLSYD